MALNAGRPLGLDLLKNSVSQSCQQHVELHTAIVLIECIVVHCNAAKIDTSKSCQLQIATLKPFPYFVQASA